MKIKHIFRVFGAAGLALAVHAANADTLEQESFSITSSAGGGGSGSSSSDMIFASYGSDGWGWSGGAGGVQGSSSVTNTGGSPVAANETFKFDIGATIDALNAEYGVGMWTIANATLTFTSSNAVQNNSRFGVGSGSFDIYWVANDDWAQSKGTATDSELNPVYASSESELAAWAGSDALLDSATYSTAGTTGYQSLSFSLALDQAFLDDIYGASASGNSFLSLYLMAMDSDLGMIIFTGGQGQALPTLSFDVVDIASTTAPAVPLPSSALLFMSGMGLFGAMARRRQAA